jgi:hypothetical protein
MHSVGATQSSLDVWYKKWDTITNKYLAQIVVDTDKAYEVLPYTITKGKAVFCYHVGNANSNLIGLEMAESSTIKYTDKGANLIGNNPTETKKFVLATYNNSV